MLEEPELSLHNAVVEQIPLMIDQVQKTAKRRQIFISTHSETILNNQGINFQGIIILEPGREGSHVRSINEIESKQLEAGFTISEAVLPKTSPKGVSRLGLWG